MARDPDIIDLVPSRGDIPDTRDLVGTTEKLSRDVTELLRNHRKAEAFDQLLDLNRQLKNINEMIASAKIQKTRSNRRNEQQVILHRLEGMKSEAEDAVQRIFERWSQEEKE
jgi:hypothetical protein